MISFIIMRLLKENIGNEGNTSLRVSSRSATLLFLISALVNDAVSCSNYTASVINKQIIE
jgi:cystathionine beta-lyase family protein involved in aluminum resistance